MPVWLLEIFGNRALNQLFWLATAVSAPFWLLMIGFPHARVTRLVCRQWLAPPLLGLFYGYLFYLAYRITGLPELEDVGMKSVRRFWGHPILFIALWMHRLTMDLFVGIWIHRFAEGRRWDVRLELILVWIGGPIGAFVFALRYWFARAMAWRRKRGR